MLTIDMEGRIIHSIKPQFLLWAALCRNPLQRNPILQQSRSSQTCQGCRPRLGLVCCFLRCETDTHRWDTTQSVSPVILLYLPLVLSVAARWLWADSSSRQQWWWVDTSPNTTSTTEILAQAEGWRPMLSSQRTKKPRIWTEDTTQFPSLLSPVCDSSCSWVYRHQTPSFTFTPRHLAKTLIYNYQHGRGSSWEKGGEGERWYQRLAV